MKIICQNSNGITQKIRQIPHTDIIVLTETHQKSKEKEKLLRSFTEYTIHHSEGDQKSKGITILVRQDIKHQAINISRTGNYIALQFEHNTETYTLIGVYLEPEDYATERLKNVVEEIENIIRKNENIILTGDFNSIRDVKDTKIQTIQTKNLRQKHQTLMAPLLTRQKLKDIWREKNENTTEFTHISRTNATRIDRAYCSGENIPKIKICHKTFGAFDHKGLQLNIGQRIKWGKGLWKLNVKLLESEETKQGIKTLIEELKSFKYKYEPLEWWDFFKKKLKNHLMTIGIQRKQEQQKTLIKLENELKLKEQSGISNMQEIIELKGKIHDIHKEHLEASRIRARIEKLKYMDKPSKYFYDLEKMRGKSKNIEELSNENGNTINTKEDILAEIEHFYTKLYSQEPTNKTEQEKIYKLLEKKQIDPSEMETLGDFITTKEIKTALNQMQSNKSPGSDGIPNEFYKTFWPELKEELCEMLNNIYIKQSLSQTQKQAIIKLLYKKGDPRELKNWRPISLLNTDYKILSKIMANRLKPKMEILIGKDQYCGVPNRSINTANSILTNIWNMEKKYIKNKLIYLMIDQQKAFDRVDHQYLLRTLKALNLPDNFIDWVKIMYTDIYSNIEINGTTTQDIKISRSVRQGCPLSMLLFILTAEGLAEKIRANPEIKGYNITPNIEKKIAAYADDTTLILTTKKSIDESLKMIEEYCNASGALTNIEKTEAIILGPWKLKDLREILSWIKDRVKILGIHYTLQNMEHTNYVDILNEIGKKIENWGKRAHNMLGRSHLINIYAMPKIMYRLRHIDIPKDQLKNLKSKIFNFLWKDKIQSIAQEKISKPRHLGGTGLFDIQTRQQAMWTQELLGIINNPNTEENLLKRSTLGPSPKLQQKIRAQNYNRK